MNAVAYTAICGGRDVLRHTGRARPGSEPFMCFTDVDPPCQPYLGWDLRPADTTIPTPRLRAKSHQIRPHLYLDADVTCYMDGTHVLKEALTVEGLAEEFLTYTDVAVFEHSERECAYEEAEYCIEKGLDDPAVIRAQMARYRAEGFPEGFGLPAITMMLRRRTPQVEKLSDLWWEEVQGGSVRDQLSFPYACWRLGVKWETIPGWAYLNKFFHYVPHGMRASEGGFADVLPY